MLKDALQRHLLTQVPVNRFWWVTGRLLFTCKIIFQRNSWTLLTISSDQADFVKDAGFREDKAICLSEELISRLLNPLKSSQTKLRGRRSIVFGCTEGAKSILDAAKSLVSHSCWSVSIVWENVSLLFWSKISKLFFSFPWSTNEGDFMWDFHPQSIVNPLGTMWSFINQRSIKQSPFVRDCS